MANITAATRIQIGSRQLAGAQGFLFFPKDIFPTLRAGGMNFSPKSAIQSGLTPTFSLVAAAPATVPADVTVTVAAGRADLDEQEALLKTAVNLVFTPVGVSAGLNYFRFFLQPTRKLQPILMTDMNGTHTPPTVSLNGDPVEDGDWYGLCSPYPGHLRVHTFYKRVLGAWVETDPTFESNDLPVQGGLNRHWGGMCKKKITASNFTINSLEGEVYITTKVPFQTTQPPMRNLRHSASLDIGTAQLFYHVLPMNVTATFTNGSPTVTLNYGNRSDFADIVSSISNTTALKIDGAALLTAGYAPSTGVITLAANYAGTTGTKQVQVTPVTAGNNYILSINRSELTPSYNSYNP